MDRCIVAGSTMGVAAHAGVNSEILLTCCDLYGNAGGDWVGTVASQAGINGNICEDPLFCDPPAGNFRLQPDSPCGPFTSPNPECDLIGAHPVGCASSVPQPAAAPSAVRLYPAVPNPFREWTRIGFEIVGDIGGTVQIGVYDAAGRLVRVLAHTPRRTGRNSVAWDGRNQIGRPVPAGVYYGRLLQTEGSRTQTLLVVR